MRCTAPMKAPSPPPTMPRRMRLSCFIFSSPGEASKAQHPLQLRSIGARPGKVVERLLGHPDDVIADEPRTFRRPLLRMLEAAFPLEHRPAFVAVLRHLREDRLEVDLPVAERAEAPGAVHPRLVARVHALAAVRAELGVLDMQRLDARVVDVDELEVVELLQHEVRWVVVDAAARVVVDTLEEHLEGRAVEQVLARMQLEADVAAGGFERIEDRAPALRQLVERGFDQAGRPLPAP